jgi:Fe-S-cluster containining protein
MYSSAPFEGTPADFIDQTRRLFSEMDRDYRQVAAASGFVCTGCEENCCRSLFYHHTFLEYVLLRAGFETLSRAGQRQILQRATAYVRSIQTRGRQAGAEGLMCPLNEQGRCILYAVRPMICRLHGTPHVFSPPGQRKIEGPGCRAFYRRIDGRQAQCLDRTPHYIELARLEARFKQHLALNQKIKLTVAEMLLREPTGTVAEAILSSG